MAQDRETVLIEDDDEDKKVAGQEDEYVAVEEKPTGKEENDEDDDDDEARGASSHDDDDDEDREALRERRRLEKKERKERREKAMSRDKIELNFLRQRNDDLERRLNSVEQRTMQSGISDIDRSIQEAVHEAELAEKVIAKAVEAGNGEDVTKAMRYRDQAVAKAQQLAAMKQQAAQAAQQPKTQTVDNEVAHYAKEFMETNNWYDPTGRDEDSAIVMAIDNKLAAEGYDPRTEEYWDELQARVERRLPEKFKKQQREERRQPGGPRVGSGREHAPTSTRKEVYISPERKAAMIEAGVWDDPVLRARYVKRYAEYDRQHGNS